MKNLIGKKFRYKSKYGGLSDWEGTISKVKYYYKGIGEPKTYIPTLGGNKLPLYEKYEITDRVNYITSNNNVGYKLDEIEIID